MINLKGMLKTAKKLELKYIIAQTTSAQAGDIELALSMAKLDAIIPNSNGNDKDPNIQTQIDSIVTPLLDLAKVKSTDSVDININVNFGPKVSFIVLINPVNPKAAQTLSLLLMKNFSKKMEDVIKQSNLTVANSIIIKWLSYKA